MPQRERQENGRKRLPSEGDDVQSRQIAHRTRETGDHPGAAKEVQPLVDKLVGLAKRGDLHARRRALSIIHDRDVVHKLFDEIGPRYTDATAAIPA